MHTFQYESKHQFLVKQYGNVYCEEDDQMVGRMMSELSGGNDDSDGDNDDSDDDDGNGIMVSNDGMKAVMISPSSSYRIKYWIRHVCLQRAKEAIVHHVKHVWFNDKLSVNVGGTRTRMATGSDDNDNMIDEERRVVRFREQLLNWSERSEHEKHEFVASLVDEAQNWERIQVLNESWDYSRQRMNYSGRLGGFHCSVTVLPNAPTIIRVDEMEQDDLENDDDLSLSFSDQLRFR